MMMINFLNKNFRDENSSKIIDYLLFQQIFIACQPWVKCCYRGCRYNSVQKVPPCLKEPTF